MSKNNKFFRTLAGTTVVGISTGLAVACGDDTMSPASVNDEQKIINGLAGTKKYDTIKALEPVVNAPFTINVATQFKISGFMPKRGFTYLYSHPGTDQDGPLSLTILVKTNMYSATNAIPHNIEIIGLDLVAAQKIIDTIDETKVSNLDKSKLPSSNANANPTIINATNATITRITPNDEGHSLELEITVTVKSKSLRKSIIIRGFPLTQTQQTTINTQGQNAASANDWTNYLDILTWDSPSDKQIVESAFDWTGSAPILKSDALQNLQSKILPLGFTLPSSLTSIGGRVFKGMTLPKGFSIPNTIASIESSTFFEAVLPEGFTLPNSIISIGLGAFDGAKLPESFALPDSISIIDAFSFRNMILPSGFRIPPNVTTLFSDTFANSTLPRNFVLPNGLITLSSRAFGQAILAEGFLIPATTITIQQDAFSGANISGLRWVYLDANGQADPNRPAPGPLAGTTLIASQ